MTASETPNFSITLTDAIAIACTESLVEALADLLLQAPGAGGSAKKGGTIAVAFPTVSSFYGRRYFYTYPKESYLMREHDAAAVILTQRYVVIWRQALVLHDKHPSNRTIFLRVQVIPSFGPYQDERQAQGVIVTIA